jgi:hypothetical protein
MTEPPKNVWLPGRKKTGGRVKGTPNKTTVVLKDAILQAAGEAHPEGMVAYLVQQARANPQAFLSLLGRVLPMTVDAELKGEMVIKWLDAK